MNILKKKKKKKKKKKDVKLAGLVTSGVETAF
jgi:hypothetical protein